VFSLKVGMLPSLLKLDLVVVILSMSRCLSKCGVLFLSHAPITPNFTSSSSREIVGDYVQI
jgi:hypothetical protein